MHAFDADLQWGLRLGPFSERFKAPDGDPAGLQEVVRSQAGIYLGDGYPPSEGVVDFASTRYFDLEARSSADVRYPSCCL
jgi:hypothetical protein